jgi:acyl transferase domain-containing protein/thioesterase domain-containing protein/acyl carrier protein
MSYAAVPDHHNSLEIAIVGMAGRFPGAKDLDELWQHLRDGVESIAFFSDEELAASGIDPTVPSDSQYVKARGVLEDAELFDAAFFGFSPREAELMDPQHRLFLACAWEALEHAGYTAEAYTGSIGVYAGASMNTYLLRNLYPNRDLIGSGAALSIGSDKDHLATRVSYKLNLDGPSVVVQTACSTSLVAVHLACQSLLGGECDVALAGGVSVIVPQKVGHVYQEGGIYSPDGHCRAFDARAQGTVFGNGVGIVVLKRLQDALAEGDCIHAVIKGSAINNDGSSKVGYTAPSVEGQARVIARALAMADIDPDTISYIEAHGTGTALGDPIEIAALTQAFRARTDRKGFCAIGSVKTNVGHLDVAAGVTGLIKTVLALQHKMLPPSLHFEQPNPQIDFANSPFYVNSKLADWPAGKYPRRAGVSSFGIGGTNAHVVLEEAPPYPAPEPSRPWQVLVLSAKTPTALETATVNLAKHLRQHTDLNPADVTYTLQVGRRAFSHRRMLVCHDLTDAFTTLETLNPQRVFTDVQETKDRPVAFMFPGQGAQYVHMALELYQLEPTFREHVDTCSELLTPHLGLDLRQLLYPHPEQASGPTQQLQQTWITQPALFAIEYALAQLWMEWGIHPQAMIGHSIGEYVAACLAGVFSLEDALALVAARGRLMQQLPGGAMLAVPLPEQEVQSLLHKKLSLAAINGPSLCVVSGPTDAVEAWQSRLTEQGVSCLRVHTSHAFHSEMMEPILEPFAEQVNAVNLEPPKIPYISNVTGTWITAVEATSPSYWTRHLRKTVHFAAGLHELLQDPGRILLEVGPGRTLSTLAGRHPQKATGQVVLSSLRHPQDQVSDVAFLLHTLGQLWLAGLQVDWSGFYAHERRHRHPLPTYPFERQRYWVEPQKQAYEVNTPQRSSLKKSDIADWFYIPSWKRSVTPQLFDQGDLAYQKLCWLVFMDPYGLGAHIVERLEQRDQDVITVTAGEQFSRISHGVYNVDLRQRDDYAVLLKELVGLNKIPNMIIHLWNIISNDHAQSAMDTFQTLQDLGFCSLISLAQALGKQNILHPLRIGVVSTHIQQVTGEEVLCPEKATVLGPCKVIPQEYPNISCLSIDISMPQSGTPQEAKLIDHLLAEMVEKQSDSVIAYRGDHRWVETFQAVRLEGKAKPTSRLRENGVYLLTGGLGNIGLVLAEYLARTVRAKLILIGRSAFPRRDAWEQWLATHGEEDPISRRICKVQALEELGAEVLVISADVASEEQMQSVISQAYKRFGTINGVIHSAGIVGEHAKMTVREMDFPDYDQHFRSKVYGLYVLERVLQGRELDFCILQSSLSSVLGGLAFSAYSAANLFMDAFARKYKQVNPVPWISVNWDTWRSDEEKESNIGMGATLARLAITPEEGMEAFRRILSLDTLTQIVVSTGDLQTRIEQWVKLIPLQNTQNPTRISPSSDYPRPNIQNAYVAPTNELEQAIVDVWREMLGIDQVGIYDNFFELGGHSLLAVRLFAQIEKTFGKNLPLVTLLQAPTIAQLATILRQEDSSAPWSSLVAIQPSGSRPPFFCVHGHGGNILFCRDLARLLGPDQPFYGLQAQGLDGNQAPHTRVEDMAAHYIRELRTLQPEGPYYLGGYCFGGLVAFEMAQQLLAQAQLVALLALFDTYAPGPRRALSNPALLFYKICRFAQRAHHYTENVFLLQPQERLSYVLEKAQEARRRLKIRSKRRVGTLLRGISGSLPAALQGIEAANIQAIRTYVPHSYPGRLTLFPASKQPAGLDYGPDMGWAGLAAGGVEVHEVPGYYGSIVLEPRVRILADRLRACLDKVQTMAMDT